MKHVFKKGTSSQTLILFHGTGGNENDLLQIGSFIDQDANILSIRGQVLEHGMPRYFKRIQEGVFDEEDLVYRTHELYQFIIEQAKAYDFDLNQLIGFGYSNGANILSSLIFHYPQLFKGAILSHPMIPFKTFEVPILNDLHVFIGACMNDPLIDIDESKALKDIYENKQAKVNLYIGEHGHRISQEELKAFVSWYQTNIKKS